MKQFLFLSVPFGIVAIFVMIAVFLAIEISPAHQPKDFQAANEFAWVIRESNWVDHSKAQYLVLDYKDGRKMMVLVASITGFKFYPKSWAEQLNFTEPYAEIVAGGKMHRIDFNSGKDAEEFFKLIFGSNAKVLMASDTYSRDE
jgi:hypothetical protein